MRQVLFTIPDPTGWFGGGIPMYGFGAMLFVCFVVVTVWGSRRARRTAGLPPERFQDMVIWIFVAGLIGARVLYMIQYASHFPNKSILGLVGAFFKIWEGGIIFYGSALGGAIGYGLFYWFVLRRLRINGWKLADAAAPLLALGLAIGRIGCYLNGCCWGQAACEECKYVPLGAAHFPLLPAHARQQLVGDVADPIKEPSLYLQSATGFVRAPRATPGGPVLEVVGVEPGSAADRAGVKVGDRVVKVNGEDNEMKGPTSDRLDELIRAWPRGKSALALVVERQEGGEAKTVELPPFAPRTVGLYPTQLYETLSMGLLILFLLAYYPFRRHDGQLMTLLMACYAYHRFVDESLRIEPVVGAGLTLSQWGSVVIFLAAVAMEVYLWRTAPSRWSGAGASAPAPAVSPPATPAPA